jgi:DNA-binding NarL/FixJ family response regulator
MPIEKQIRIMAVEDHPVFKGGLEVLISSQPEMFLVVQASNTKLLLHAGRRAVA